MSANRDIDVVEREVQKTQVAQAPWYQRISWRAIFAGVVIALLTQFLLEMLGVALGVGALEPGEDTLGPEFSSAVVIWLTGSALLSLFAGGLATGRLSESTDGLSNALMAIVMMGVATFISFFLLSFALSSTVRGVSNAVGEGLSFVGSTAEDVSTAVADAVELRDGTLDEIRTEADEILADDASLTSLRIALDDYLLADEPGEDTRQAAIEAITTQTTLNEAEASQQLDEWEADLTQAIDRLEAEAEQVASDVADIVAATAGVIFVILLAGVFAAAAGGFVGGSPNQPMPVRERKVVTQRKSDVVTSPV